MAHLLDLVDQLIGDILHGNVFTDIDTFRPSLPLRPAGADQGIPNADPRLLNVQAVKAHPHAGSPIVPSPQHSPPPQPPGPPHIPGQPIPAIPGPPHIPGIVEPANLGPAHIPGQPIPAVAGPDKIPVPSGGNTDPRLLNFPGRGHPPGTIPDTNKAGDPIHSALGTTNDPRLLNFNDANPHPHAGLAGPGGEHNAKTHVIPTEPNALHDNQGAFLTPSQVAGMLAKQTPGGKRGEIYAGSKFTPGSTPPDVGDQINQVSTPLDPVTPRDEIYSKSASGNRLGGPLSDLLAFHESKSHPHAGTVVPNAPPALNAESPGYVNNSGKHPAEHGKIGEPVPLRDEIYQNSHPKDDTIKAPADPLASVPPGHPHIGPESQIPNPETRHLPATQTQTLLSHHRPDGYSPSQHGSPPDSLTPENYEAGTTGLREWNNIEGPKREELYSKTPNFVPPIPPDVISQKDITTDLAQGATKFPANTPPEFNKDPAEAYDPVRRDDIYSLADGLSNQVRSNVAGTPLSRPTAGDQLAAQGKRPPTLNFQGSNTGDVPVDGGDFSVAGLPDRPHVLERPFGVDGVDTPLGGNRDDLASKHHELRQGPNANLNPNLGDLLATARPHGLIGKVASSDGHRGGQVYADGYTAVQGAGGEILKYLDVIAAAKWFENVRKEIGAIIPVITVKAQQDDRNNLAKSTEGIVKSVVWPVSQLLLTAFNPTDTAGYGELNAIWNPLSFAASIIPLLRSTPITHITVGAAAAGVGFSGYIQNVMDSVSDKSERLLQMREGNYKKSLDGTTLAQLNLGDAGFEGDLTHVGIGPSPNIEATDLLGALVNLGSDLIASGKKTTIATQVDTDIAAELGMHGNIYTLERPYSATTAIFPLENMREIASDLEQAGGADDIPVGAQKLADLFTAKSWPGSPEQGALPLTWIANPRPGRFDGIKTQNLADAPGLNAAVVNTDLGGDDEFGTGVTENLILDDDLYMPFMFQDLRDDPPQFLYFRAFLKEGMSETFTPDWQTERYYGRVDQIPIYQGTIRSISLAFDVVAFSPLDLPVMYRKLEKLQSMVYPSYNTQGFINAGPIIRMRVGDLFATKVAGQNGGRGLPGYITSMDWSYDDGIWDIETQFKVPRKVTVSLGFTVLHNGNPGTYPNQEVIYPNDGSEPSVQTAGISFGAGKFTSAPESDANRLVVSRAEIRKIFDTVKPTEN